MRLLPWDSSSCSLLQVTFVSHRLAQPLLGSQRRLLHLDRIMPTQMPTRNTASRPDLSVILVTGSYDHEIRFWEAWSGICSRTIARAGESGVRDSQLLLSVYEIGLPRL